ncbi:MAG: NrsF family protein [Alphaproteobacteria bacterium]
MTKRSTEELIENLSRDLKPSKPFAHPLWRGLVVLAIIFVWVGYGVYVTGLRHDVAERLGEAAFLFEVISAVLIILSSAFVALWMSIPDMRGQKWMIALPCVLVFHFCIWLACKAYAEGVMMPALHLDHCFTDGFYMAAIPAALLMAMVYRGATTLPYIMAFMVFLSTGFLAYLGLRFTCPMDTVGHAFIFHIFPYLILGMVVGALARRIFKW